MTSKGERVDELIKARDIALSNVISSERELASLGVKMGHLINGVPTFEVSQNYLPGFTEHFEEYEWEATFKDGSVIRQFGIDGEHHFGDIDQSQLLLVRFISNFEWHTDNVMKRVVVELDWLTGDFRVHNGLVSDSQTRIALVPLLERPEGMKLVLFGRKRMGQQAYSFGESTGGIYLYKRYFLGYEYEGGKRRVMVLYPNGEIEIEHKYNLE